ncbi:hypothetical protein H0H87_009366 [Tephrocybe sp. NHM501043]|nr:hypothetical protein H0H87_009366 [Tephrocybe sp. NHM501043]
MSYQPPPGPPPQIPYYIPPPVAGHPGYPAPTHQHIPPQQHASTNHAPPPPLFYLGTYVANFYTPPTDSLVPGYDPRGDAERIRSATKGLGTADGMLIATLTPLTALQMQALANRFMSSYGLSLVSVLESETSYSFKFALRGLALGPLAWDVFLLRWGMKGIGSNESVLTELLIGRPMPDIHLLTQAYQYLENRNLTQDIKSELSMKTERMFVMALSSDRPPDSTPVDHAQVSRDVDALYKAGEGRNFGTDEMVFCDILINRTQPHITAMYSLPVLAYRANPKRDRNGVYRDTKLIYKAMQGMGTQDDKLVWRIVRAHWDKNRLEGIKATYFHRRQTTLVHRVDQETSGSYQKLLTELIEPGWKRGKKN